MLTFNLPSISREQQIRTELQSQMDENNSLRQSLEVKKNEHQAMKQRQEEERKRRQEEESRLKREAEQKRKKEEEERKQKEREMEGREGRSCRENRNI